MAMAMFQSPSSRGSGRFKSFCERQSSCEYCFNPLHRGAVVASCGPGNPGDGCRLVSIPFIAGQWSLLTRCSAS